MDAGARVVAGLAGAGVVIWTVISAIITVVVPHGIPVRLTRWVFSLTMVPFRARACRVAEARRRESVLAAYGPTALLVLPLVWLLLVIGGGTLLEWTVGVDSWRKAFVESGSSLFTLGFVGPRSVPQAALDFAEAALGLGLLALLIAYLPSIYASFSRREAMVTGLETQAGAPPSATQLMERLARIGALDDTADLWESWSAWFADIEETHVSTPSLVFFRSPQAERSWVTASGAVLDAAAFLLACIDVAREPQAALCIRSGYIALRRIAAFYGIAFDADPRPDDPVSIGRDEFDHAWARVAAAGAPMKLDRDRAWADFAGWRVNYDTVLLGLASLTLAPEAPWSSDRAAPGLRPPLNPRRAGAAARFRAGRVRG